MKNYYYILGVDRDATSEQIKQAYRKLSKKYHPDKNDGDKFFEERFKQLQEAYETLSHPNRRKTYDSANPNNSQSHNNKRYEEQQRRAYEEELRKSKEEFEELLKKQRNHQDEIDELNKNIHDISKRKSKTLIYTLSTLVITVLAFGMWYILYYKINKYSSVSISSSTVSIGKEKQPDIVDQPFTDTVIEVIERLPKMSIDGMVDTSKKYDDLFWILTSDADSLKLIFNDAPPISISNFSDEHNKEFRKFSYWGTDRDKLVVSIYSGGAHCCENNYVFEKIGKNIYKNILSSTLGGEIEIFNDIISLLSYESYGYFHSCYACNVELPIENYNQINLKFNNTCMYLMHDSNLNSNTILNLSYLKRRGIPELLNKVEYQSQDDGTRKTFLGQMITYYYNNDQNIEQTHSIFNQYFNSVDKDEMWTSVVHTINTINNNIKIIILNPETNPANNSYKYYTYPNNRYRYVIDYPDNLIAQPVAENNDGRIFSDNDRNEILKVYGMHHFDESGKCKNLKEVYESDLKKLYISKAITYKKLGDTYFIISGTEKGKIYYQKTITLVDGFGYAILEYPENEKAFYAAICERIKDSFIPIK